MIYYTFEVTTLQMKKNKSKKEKKVMSKKNKKQNDGFKNLKKQFLESERKWEKASPMIEFFAEHPDVTATIIGKSARGGTFKVKKSDLAKYWKPKNMEKMDKIKKLFLKYRRYICPHHLLNKKGSVVPVVVRSNGDEVRCLFCDQTFDIRSMDPKEIHRLTEEQAKAIQKFKFLIRLVGHGDDVYKLLVELLISNERTDEVLTLVNEYTSKAKAVSNQKKKKVGPKRGMSGWSMRF